MKMFLKWDTFFKCPTIYIKKKLWNRTEGINLPTTQPN